ncbi:MAG: CPBP family intramembrane metalloprotease [Gammaproteobacteria bacterium]|nr:CPBP family intramembrane metalloprotease [Gammaproteobacteria bacterium]
MTTKQKPVAWMLVVAWFMMGYYLPGLNRFLDTFGFEWQWYWWDLTAFYYGYFYLFIAIILSSQLAKIRWSSFFEHKLNAASFKNGIWLTLFCFIFSIGAAYLLFYPLSFVIPEFVDSWYIQTSDIIYHDGVSFPIVANILSLIALVVLPSVLEEFAFRGVMLRVWSQKWGFWKAATLSSFIFGILHADPIGAFAFGIAMSYLYIRYQNLLLPILCHALNNFVVWLLEVLNISIYGVGDEYQLSDFQAEWYIGLICMVISAAWAQRYWPNRNNRLYVKQLSYPESQNA